MLKNENSAVVNIDVVDIAADIAADIAVDIAVDNPLYILHF